MGVFNTEINLFCIAKYLFDNFTLLLLCYWAKLDFMNEIVSSSTYSSKVFSFIFIDYTFRWLNKIKYSYIFTELFLLYMINNCIRVVQFALFVKGNVFQTFPMYCEVEIYKRNVPVIVNNWNIIFLSSLVCLLNWLVLKRYWIKY